MTQSQSENAQPNTVKNRMASHPAASPELLKKLTHTDSHEVLERVAENAQTSTETLEKLSSHDEAAVRSAVSDNENTPDATMQALAEDEHPDVRFRVAENPQVKPEILETLASDENPYVAARAQETLSKVTSVLQQADQKLVEERFPEAEELYRKLAAGLQDLLGNQNCEVASVMHKLAAALAGQGKTEQAAEVEEQARLVHSTLKS